MKKKKFILLRIICALVLVLTFIYLTACNNAQTPEQDDTSDQTDAVGDGNDTDAGSDDGAGSGNISGDCAAHKDTDDNGYCDTCNEYVIVVIDFYAINDLHGRIFDTDQQPGVDELTTYLKNANTTDDHVIVLASGDMWQGTSESNLTRGKMMTEWLNEIGTVSMTLGNHEFDWSNEYIYANAEIADFPFLAINIYDTATNKRVDFATPSVIVEKGDAKIGIIGAIGDCHSSISQDKVAGINFKVGSELAALVKEESEKLRNAGCDYIVFSVHDGLSKSGSGLVSNGEMESYYDIALSDGYVDLVFESHSHCDYILLDSKGVYHIQGGAENNAISHVEVSLNYANDKSNITEIANVSSSKYDDCTPDNIVNKLKEKYKDTIAKGSEVIGDLDRVVSGDELRQLCADLYVQKGVEKWGSQYNIVCGGGYISIRSPGALFAGEVCYEDIYTLFPFDNGLYLCTISGSDLKSKFIYSNNGNYFVGMSDYGNSVNIVDSETYYIVTDAYSAFYAPNNLTIVADYGEELFARDFIAEFIKNGGYEEKPEAKLTITPIPDIIRKLDSLGVNVESTEYFTVMGTIIDDPQSTYGNCTIRDIYGNTIYIYGLYGTDGTRYDGLEYKPLKGDMIIARGIGMLYVKDASTPPKYELKDAAIQVMANTTDLGNVIEAGNALADNGTTADSYLVFGKVKDTPQQTYGNMTIVDAVGNELYIYGVYDATGEIRYDAMSVKPVEGDIVLLLGNIKKYLKTADSAPLIEMMNARRMLIVRDNTLIYV